MDVSAVRVLDTLMAEHPNAMIEGTSSGGRRLDIGTIRRSHTCWFSDSIFNALMCHDMPARANRFLPGNLLNSSVGIENGNGDKGLSETSVLSRMLGKLQFDGDITGLSPELAGRMGGLVKAFKEIRHLLVQDFYQLLPQPSTIDEWDAVQFVSRSGDEAALFAFSGQTAGQTNVRLRGLNATRSYRVRRVPNDPIGTRTGRDLMDQGLAVELEALTGALWTIKQSSGADAGAR
ncbi:MAG: GH36 C-terminal domain-containing protein [Chloroflexi bacterium]|nr:GH36 C-terminal domain-containing protein [Chloroflexota bacterium]